MTYDCEAPSVYEEQTRRARKAHQCCECRRTIGLGDRYQYVSGLWDGSWSRFATCLSCVEARAFFSRAPEIDCGCIAMGDLLSTVREAFRFGWSGLAALIVDDQSAATVGWIMGLLWRRKERDHDIRQRVQVARRQGRVISAREAMMEMKAEAA